MRERGVLGLICDVSRMEMVLGVVFECVVGVWTSTSQPRSSITSVLLSRTSNFVKLDWDEWYERPITTTMYKWHANSAIGRGRYDLQRCAEGIASSLRAFHVSARRAEDDGTLLESSNLHRTT